MLSEQIDLIRSFKKSPIDQRTDRSTTDRRLMNASNAMCAARHGALPPSPLFARHCHHPQRFHLPATTSPVAARATDVDVVVVGAGVAGLNCARALHRSGGIDVKVLEASDGVGGRVRTDVVDGFKLDRGFQIFLTSYPEARKALDYNALDLQPFYAGALVRFQGGFHVVADPFRHLFDALGSLTPANPIGSPVDKVLVGVKRTLLLLRSVEEILRDQDESTIEERLQRDGFSPAIIDRFFRPFLGGIFFRRDLSTTSRLLNFVLRMLATGSNCLPSGGIGAVAEQLAAGLPKDAIMLNTAVRSVKEDGATGEVVVELENGERVRAKKVVVATEGPQAAKLLGDALERSPSQKGDPVGTACLYFSADEPPRKGNYLYLDGDNKGSIVNNCCVPSEVSSSYAPAGKSLISVSVIGTRPDLDDEELQRQVLDELAGWFGRDKVSAWAHLRTYRIPFSQPPQTPPTDLFKTLKLTENIYVAGDHRMTATLDGALWSGRLVAEQIISSR